MIISLIKFRTKIILQFVQLLMRVFLGHCWLTLKPVFNWTIAITSMPLLYYRQGHTRPSWQQGLKRPTSHRHSCCKNMVKIYLIAIYRNFNANNNFLFVLLSKGVKALAKCWNFKCEFQTKYSSYQHETNASNSGRTWSFWWGTYCFWIFSIWAAKSKKLKWQL